MIDRTGTAAWPSRAVARSTRWMVASPHPLATAAGVDVLRRGGNAVDAAIAANAVLTVVYPASCGIGGDAFWIVHDPNAVVHDANAKRTVAYNGSGRTPRAAALDRLPGGTLPKRGALTVTVPGAVRSWEEVGKAHGTRGLDELLAPAELLARNGVAITDVVANYAALNAALLRADADARRIFLPDGVPPKAGDILCNPELGDTLGDLAGVERVGAAAPDRAERVAELGVAQDVAGLRRHAVGEEDALRVGVGAQQCRVERGVVRDHVGDRDAVAREQLSGREQLVEAACAVCLPDLLPRTHRARDRYRQRAALRQRAAGEPVERGGARGAAAPVVGDGALRVGVVHDRVRIVYDPERVAADPAARRVDHREHRVGGDRRVDGVAAAPQHVDAGRGRERVRRSDHPARRACDGAARPGRRSGPIDHLSRISVQ